jgi:hypothetical protein
MLPQAVHLQATLVIDVHILLLSGCKEELIVQEGDCTGGLLHLEGGVRRDMV